MKIQSILLLAVMALFLGACQNNAPSEAATTATEAVDSTAQNAAAAANVTGDFNVNTQTSVIEWTGTKPDGSSHTGTIKLQSGLLNVFSGNVTGGKMVIDMNTLSVSDIQGEDKAKLEGHLKDADFFEVAKFPTGSFEFGSVEKATGNTPGGTTHVVVGALTLRGVTAPIRIPATLTVTETGITATTPEFGINRTEWGVKYNSGIIGTIKDKLIDDIVKLKIKLEASK